MNHSGRTYLSRALFGSYLLFAVSSTFSIALAQLALGAAVILFIIYAALTGYTPGARSLKWVYRGMSLYVLWMILAAIIAENTANSLHSLADNWLFLAVPVGVLVMQDQRHRRHILQAFSIALIIISLYGILQYLTGITFFKSQPAIELPYGGHRAQGSFTHALTYGNYMAVASVTVLAAALHPKSDFSALATRLAIPAGTLGLVATILSFSRGPMLGMFIALLILAALLRSRRAIITVAICGLVAAAVIWQLPGMSDRFTERTTIQSADTYQGGRLYIWNHSWQVLKQHPVTGVGPGNFREYYQTTLPDDIHPRFIFPHAHNDPLHIATVGGVPAALIWLLLWLAVLILAWRGLHLDDPHRPAAPAYSIALLTGSLMFLMTSLTEATFFDDEVRQLAMFIWALGLADWYNKQSPHQGAGKTT